MKHHDSNKKLFKYRNQGQDLLWGILVLTITFLAAYKIASVDDLNDYVQHYDFSQMLPMLRNIPLDTFLKSVFNAKILSYPVWHIVCFIFSKIIALFIENNQVICWVSAALVTSIFEVGGFFACRFALEKFTQASVTRSGYSLFTLIILVMGPLYVPFINKNYYLGQLTANTWHNPTTIAVKAISVLCLIWYVNLFQQNSDTEKKQPEFVNYIIAALLLALTSICKPSFYQMFVPGLALACLIELLRTKGRAFAFCMKMFFSVIPVMLVAIIQMKLSFAEQGNGIGFKLWYVVDAYSQHPLSSFLISIPFALFVYLLAWKEIISNRLMLVSGCAFLSGTMQYAILYQTLDAFSGNFAWGAYLGVNLINIASVCTFIKNKSEWKQKYIIIGYILLGTQVLFGAWYLGRIIIGGTL